jgi:hypothetical protein
MPAAGFLHLIDASTAAKTKSARLGEPDAEGAMRRDLSHHRHGELVLTRTAAVTAMAAAMTTAAVASATMEPAAPMAAAAAVEPTAAAMEAPAAATPTVPARAAAPAKAAAVLVAAPIPARALPAVVIPAVILAAKKELRLLDLRQVCERLARAQCAIADRGLRRARCAQRHCPCHCYCLGEFA